MSRSPETQNDLVVFALRGFYSHSDVLEHWEQYQFHHLVGIFESLCENYLLHWYSLLVGRLGLSQNVMEMYFSQKMMPLKNLIAFGLIFVGVSLIGYEKYLNNEAGKEKEKKE